MTEETAYYGTKRVTAWPEVKTELVPTGIATTKAESTRHGYGVRYADGYVSWSPAAVFEAAYQPETAMPFSSALVALKDGQKIARAGWNGKGMFLWLKDGNIDLDQKEAGALKIDGVSIVFFEPGDKGTVIRLPCICMRTATGATLEGWLASQTDLLASDWMVI